MCFSEDSFLRGRMDNIKHAHLFHHRGQFILYLHCRLLRGYIVFGSGNLLVSLKINKLNKSHWTTDIGGWMSFSSKWLNYCNSYNLVSNHQTLKVMYYLLNLWVYYLLWNLRIYDYSIYHIEERAVLELVEYSVLYYLHRMLYLNVHQQNCLTSSLYSSMLVVREYMLMEQILSVLDKSCGFYYPFSCGEMFTREVVVAFFLKKVNRLDFIVQLNFFLFWIFHPFSAPLNKSIFGHRLSNKYKKILFVKLLFPLVWQNTKTYPD